MGRVHSSASVSLTKNHWRFLTLIGLIVCFPIFIKTYFLTRVGIVLILIIINVTGMTLLTRYAGVVSLGHSAFYALGAYMSAILTVRLHYNPWIAMVIAAGVTVVFAYLFAIPFLRLRRAYLAMATLGLGQVAFILAKDLTDITGGVSGIPGIPYFKIGGFVIREDWQLFYLFGFVMIFFVFLTKNVEATRLGRAYQAIRTNETAAKAMGINVQWELARVFCFSALVSSLAGSMLAHFITFISPESFTIDFSFTLLIIVIIGGANIWGTLVTAVVLTCFSELFRGFQDFSMGFYGLLLIVALFLFPDGLGAVLFPRTKKARRNSHSAPRAHKRRPRSRTRRHAKHGVTEGKRHSGVALRVEKLWRHPGPFRCVLFRAPEEDHGHNRPKRSGQDNVAERDKRIHHPSARRRDVSGSERYQKSPS